jgi:hypothetical protein
MIWAWLLLPPIAALQRFCIAYGYQGRDRDICRSGALHLCVLLYAIEVIVFLTWKAFH